MLAGASEGEKIAFLTILDIYNSRIKHAAAVSFMGYILCNPWAYSKVKLFRLKMWLGPYYLPGI